MDSEAMTQNNECCGNCRFWDEYDENMGYCRRYPPKIIGVLMESGSDGYDFDEKLWEATRHPPTFTTDWCGEFQPARNSP